MPLYEYCCEKCGVVVEKIRKFSDKPFVKCEKCGGRLKRLVSAPAFKFKGSGWYVTDYARKPSPEPSKSDGGSSAKSDESPDKTKKPEAPAAPKSGDTTPAAKK